MKTGNIIKRGRRVTDINRDDLISPDKIKVHIGVTYQGDKGMMNLLDLVSEYKDLDTKCYKLENEMRGLSLSAARLMEAMLIVKEKQALCDSALEDFRQYFGEISVPDSWRKKVLDE